MVYYCHGDSPPADRAVVELPGFDDALPSVPDGGDGVGGVFGFGLLFAKRS